MDKIVYNKLVRDRIPEIMAAKGKQFETRILKSDEELEQALLAKLKEEVIEAQTAQSRDELLEELADLAEVVKALCDLKKIDLSEIEAVRARKLQERGKFEERLFLVWGEKD